jgi:hypothetical protein
VSGTVTSPAAITPTSYVSFDNSTNLYIHAITVAGGTAPYRIIYNNQTYPLNNPPYSQTFNSGFDSLEVIILDDNDCQISYTSE